jgi:peptidoglycan/xylan/chitin deacetylase (PgdA/CDA1 family)
MLSQKVYIITYHYVRPISSTDNPRLAALDLEDFKDQVAFLKDKFNPISLKEFIEAKTSAAELPPNACLLTFDDGYIDHFIHVFPLLKKEGISGIFFPSKQALIDREMLDVNKIQLLVRSKIDLNRLEASMEARIHELNDGENPINVVDLRKKYRIKNRFDNLQVSYIKNILQHALPLYIRRRIIKTLFEKFITTEFDNADSFYLNLSQAKEMQSYGMSFGGHGDKHLWHSHISETEKNDEIRGAKTVLNAIGQKIESYCYPFGDFDEPTISILKKEGFSLAFTVNPEVANISRGNNFMIPRFDTNDIKKNSNFLFMANKT